MADESPERRLKVLGGAIVQAAGDPLGGPAAHRHRVALLAILARSRMPVSRDKLIALLWPERDAESGRNLLRVAVHAMRKQLGEDALPSVGDQLALDQSIVPCDATEFDDAIAAKQLAVAAQLYGGPFLDGFFVKDSSEFEQWVDGERAKLAASYASVLEQLGADADVRGDANDAVRWYRVLAAHDPLRADIAVRLMTALAAKGDAPAAIRHATIQATLRRDAGMEPDATVAHLADDLTKNPTAVASVRPAVEYVSKPLPTVVPDAVAAGEALVPAPALTSRTRFLVAAFAAAVVIAAIVVVANGARDSGVCAKPPCTGALKIDPNVIAIFPFRVSGANASLGYLRDGMPELLAAEFIGEGAPSAVDPGAVARALARKSGTDADADVATVRALARSMGAGRVLVGSVVGTPQRMTVTASIIDAVRGDVIARATLIEGPADSLPMVVGAVAAALLSRDAGTWRLSAKDPGTTSSEALRAFIDGRAAYRTGRADDAFTAFARALDIDSTFVLAAYWLTVNTKMSRPLSEVVAQRAYHWVWNDRARLGQARREMLEAMFGAHGPDVPTSYGEYLRAIERVSANQPTSPEGWALLGDLYFHRGAMSGDPQWAQHTKDAFTRAVTLDTVIGPVSHLASLAYIEHDMDAHARWLAQLERIAPQHSYTLREEYAAAVARGDVHAVATARERWVKSGDAYRDSYDGFPWAVGIIPHPEIDSLIATLAQLAKTDAERNVTVYFAKATAMNGGRPIEAERARRQYTGADAAGHDFDLLTYAEDDSAAAERIVGLPAPNAGRFAAYRCEATLSRLRRGNMSDALATVTALRTVRTPDFSEAPLCVALIEGIVTSLSPKLDTASRRAALVPLDTLLRSQPLGIPVIWNYDLAVAFARLGDYRSAALAARRRQIPRSARLAITLRDEGRWAALAGDTASAIAAFHRYLVVRGSPEASRQRELDEIRAQLARLEAAQPPR